MNLSGLNPYPVGLDFGGVLVELRNFDLNAMVWADWFFKEPGVSGMSIMQEMLTGDCESDEHQSAVIDILYYLAVDPKSLGESPQAVKARIKKTGEAGALISQLLQAIRQVLEQSFPKAEPEPERAGGEIYRKLTAKKTDTINTDSTNWAQVYADFAGHFGTTIDQFYSLTMAQVEVLHREIVIAKAENLKFQGSIHGAKMKGFKIPHREKVSFTDSDVSSFEAEHLKLVSNLKDGARR